MSMSETNKSEFYGRARVLNCTVWGCTLNFSLYFSSIKKIPFFGFKWVTRNARKCLTLKALKGVDRWTMELWILMQNKKNSFQKVSVDSIKNSHCVQSPDRQFYVFFMFFIILWLRKSFTFYDKQMQWLNQV